MMVGVLAYLTLIIAIIIIIIVLDHVEDYHPDAADLYSKIALILRQDGDFERAQEEYRFACEIYEMSLGADHPETIKALNEVMEKKRLGQLSNMLKNKLKLKA